MKNVALHNLGCKVNSYEIEVMQEKLEEKGYQIVPFAPGADVYIINTCAVTHIAGRKSRQMLHKAKKMNPDAVVVAVGCYVQTDGEKVEKDDAIDLAIGNNRKKDIAVLLEEYLRQREMAAQPAKKPDKTLNHTAVIDLGSGKREYEEMSLTRAGGHARAYIKIQDGCNQFCSYCIIPFARGRARSRKPEEAVREVKGLVQAGYREVVITGVHLSAYGEDFPSLPFGEEKEGSGTQPLLHLLRQIHRIEGLERIRLGSLEPGILTEEFVKGLTGLGKLCPHFHLSLQSGCDATLGRMNRRYTRAEFRAAVEALRRAYGQPAVTADVIVGFPGETEAEFSETLEFLEEIRFHDLHVFKFSKRRGTKAALMGDQVAESVKAARSGRLIQLAKEHSAAWRSQWLGREVSVLVEEEKTIGGRLYPVGFTPSYMKAAVEVTGSRSTGWANAILAGRVQGLLADEYLLVKIANHD